MALNDHHVMRADKKLNAEEAQQFMQEMVNSPVLGLTRLRLFSNQTK